MSEQFWSQLAATGVGGLIAAIAGFVAIRYGKKLDRQDRRASLLVEAYADWAKSLEELLSHHVNLYTLKQQVQTAVSQEHKTQAKEELIRVSQETGDAGRRADSAHYRILLLDTRVRFRERVAQIMEDSMMRGMDALDSQALVTEYRRRADGIRADLKKLLKECASAT